MCHLPSLLSAPVQSLMFTSRKTKPLVRARGNHDPQFRVRSRCVSQSCIIRFRTTEALSDPTTWQRFFFSEKYTSYNFFQKVSQGRG
ncbi:unnamed protein product [Amoebophrya sp. A25]|nr:unnamed protein product [Amoebophrya sp. A25]|eukprot:GSA25T00012094001.1